MRTLDSGLWNSECGLWNSECGLWTLEIGMRTLDSGIQNADSGRWKYTPKSGPGTLGSKHSHSHTLALSYPRTLIPSHSRTLILSYSHTLALSYSRTLILSHFNFKNTPHHITTTCENQGLFFKLNFKNNAYILRSVIVYHFLKWRS